jgi:hypothetical protein
MGGILIPLEAIRLLTQKFPQFDPGCCLFLPQQPVLCLAEIRASPPFSGGGFAILKQNRPYS